MNVASLALGALGGLQRAALIRRAGRTAALVLACVALAAIALGFGIAAAYLALAPLLGPPGAAAIVAAVAASVLGVTMLIARTRRRRHAVAFSLADGLRSTVNADPVGVGLASVAAGLAVGMLLRGRG